MSRLGNSAMRECCLPACGGDRRGVDQYSRAAVVLFQGSGLHRLSLTEKTITAGIYDRRNGSCCHFARQQSSGPNVRFCEFNPTAKLLVVYRQILSYWFPRSRKSCVSISGISGRSRKRNRVAHIGEARDVSDGALEAKAKARVRHRTVAAQISVPAVVLFIYATLRHACI